MQADANALGKEHEKNLSFELTADEKVYDMIPVKQEVKAMVSGIYILSVKSLRGPALTPAPKLTFFQKIKKKFTGK